MGEFPTMAKILLCNPLLLSEGSEEHALESSYFFQKAGITANATFCKTMYQRN
jgi:hypothetical protein